MSEKEASREVISTTEKAVKQLNTGVKSTQRSIWEQILLLLTRLDKSASGNVIPNSKNVSAYRSIASRLTSVVLNPAYVRRVNIFLGEFDKLREINEEFFEEVDGYNRRSTVLREVLRSSVDLTRESLLGSGISQQVIDPITKIIEQGVTSGSPLVEMEETLRTTILGDPTRLGNLERYTTQITRDALNQFSANYAQSVAASVEMEWYFYSGTIIEDTRSYCEERAGKYFHKKEVENVPSQWPGRIPGTNSGNIYVNRGGFNCRHLWTPVLINVVPRSVIQRNIRNGNYIDPSA